MAQGSLGLGESYMDGDWDCDALDQLFDRAISHRLREKFGMTVSLALLVGLSRLQNRQTARRAKQAAQVHYDLPVDIFEATFDRRLTGSCGYWKNAATLDDAQNAKLDLICRKIGLKKGDVVLDIGCGWGAFLGYATEYYGADCLGITISPVQCAYAKNRYAGLSVKPLLEDYRGYAGPKVDHLVSMGMFEHVGAKNYRTYFECARRYMKDDGLFLLHTIWENERYPTIDAWQDKYIFPNGDLPSVGEITTAVEGLFVVEDVHNFGIFYDADSDGLEPQLPIQPGQNGRKARRALLPDVGILSFAKRRRVPLQTYQRRTVCFVATRAARRISVRALAVWRGELRDYLLRSPTARRHFLVMSRSRYIAVARIPPLEADRPIFDARCSAPSPVASCGPMAPASPKNSAI